MAIIPTSEGRLASRWKPLVLALVLLIGLWFIGTHSKPQHLIHSLSTHHSEEEELPTTVPTGKKLHPQGSYALDVAAGGGTTDRPLVLYAYAESQNARANLDFFVKRALHARADFVFIFNGESDAVEMVPDHLENVRIVQRENTCYDIGAFGEVMAKDDLYKKYKWFITLNASVRGPFMPMWSDECWTDAFLSRITDRVKLVGLTYNCIPVPHVQSMLFATDHIGMQILMDPELAYSAPLDTPPWGGPELPTGFSVCYGYYAHAVHAEIGMARLIRSQGYTVDVVLTSVHSHNADVYCNAEHAGNVNDHLSNGAYFGFNVHPYETIFAKANRGIDDNQLNMFTDWHYAINETSWDKCSRR